MQANDYLDVLGTFGAPVMTPAQLQASFANRQAQNRSDLGLPMGGWDTTGGGQVMDRGGLDSLIAQQLAKYSAPTEATPSGPPGMPDSFNNWLKDSGFLGSTDTTTGVRTDGWGAPAMGALQGIANAYLGLKQYGIAKDTLNENKRQFQLNYDAQKSTTNSALEDRQRARVAANPGAYQSVGDYMKKNGIR